MNRNDRQTFALLLVQVAVVYLGEELGGWVAERLGGWGCFLVGWVRLEMHFIAYI